MKSIAKVFWDFPYPLNQGLLGYACPSIKWLRLFYLFQNFGTISRIKEINVKIDSTFRNLKILKVLSILVKHLQF
jgi:hypothetical protein